MIHMNNNRMPGSKRASKREQTRLGAKSASPGVPANTCPYIDMVITAIHDLSNSYERLRTKGEHNPMTEELCTVATDTLEYIRRNNETLRDNSAYWYGEYKSLLRKKR